MPTPITVAVRAVDTRGAGAERTAAASIIDETHYSALAGSTFAGRVNAAPAGHVVRLPEGAFTWADFPTLVHGIRAGASITRAGLRGAGTAQTVLRMAAGSSTHAGDVPTAPGTTNQVYLMFFNRDGLCLRDLTIEGTPQGHLHGGLRLHYVDGASVSNVRLVGVAPGDDFVPPGETFAIAAYWGSNHRYEDCEVDGISQGATGFSTNSTNDTTFVRCYAHDHPYSAAFALWQGTGTFTLIGCRSDRNRTAFNLERMGREALGMARATVNIVEPTFGAIVTGGQDIFLGNDEGSTIVNIYDPVDRSARKKIRVFFPYNEQQNRNIQAKADVHVWTGGTWSGGSPGAGRYVGGTDVAASWLTFFGSGA